MPNEMFAWPFLRIPESCVDAEPWFIHSEDEGSIPLGGLIEHWDYARDIDLSRKIRLDGAAARDACGVHGDNAAFRVAVSAATGGSRGAYGKLAAEVWTGKFERNDEEDIVSINIHLNGSDQSQRLILTTEILLDKDHTSPSALSPKYTGSRLWYEKETIYLDARQSRFPMEVASFSDIFGDAPSSNSLWYLIWNQYSLEDPFLGSVTIYLNKDNPDFIAKVVDGDHVVLRMLMDGIVYQMASTLITNESFRAGADSFGPESMGGMVYLWITEAFPGLAMDTLQRMSREDPSRFQSSLSSVSSYL